MSFLASLRGHEGTTGVPPSKTLLEQETETHDTVAAAEDNVMPLSIPAASQD